MKRKFIKFSGLLIALLLSPFASAIDITSSVPLSDEEAKKQCTNNPHNIVIPERVYQKSYWSLKYLEGLYINVDDVIAGAKQREVALTKDLRVEVIERLKVAGVKLLTKDEMKQALGKPQLSFYPTFPAHLTPIEEGNKKVNVAYRADCCTASIWTSFLEGGTALRDPSVNYKISTWGEGHNTTDCSDVGSWLTDVVLKTVDNLLADKAKAEKEYEEMLEKEKEKEKEKS